MRTMLAVTLMLSLLVPSLGAQAVANGDVWRTFAQEIVPGSRIKVRLSAGERVNATLVQAAPDALLLQPITRVPVPVQRVAYNQIVSIERDEGRGGVSAAKAAAIGVASGVGTFFGIMLIFLAAAAD